jgi:hypothetical protein
MLVYLLHFDRRISALHTTQHYIGTAHDGSRSTAPDGGRV